MSNFQREPLCEHRAGIRVLHVYSGNLYGGVETFLRTMALHRSDAKGVTMDFALCFAGRIERELRATAASVHLPGAVRVRSPRTVGAARRALDHLLRSGRYDVVVCHSAWPHAVFATVVRRHDLRLVHHMHDVANPRGWEDRLANLTPPELVITNSVFTKRSSPWLFPGTPRRLVRYPAVLGGQAGRPDRGTVRASLGASSILAMSSRSRLRRSFVPSCQPGPGSVAGLSSHRTEAWPATTSCGSAGVTTGIGNASGSPM